MYNANFGIYILDELHIHDYILFKINLTTREILLPYKFIRYVTYYIQL